MSQIQDDNPITRAYGYDDVDQVTSEVLTQAGVTLQSTSYGFDGMGNRTQTQSTSTTGQSTSSYSHNRVNQTTALSTTTAQGTAQSTLSYDDEGNLLHVGSTAQSGTFYSYDDANQLSQIVNRDAAGEPTSRSTFLYDGLKRLRISRDFSWQNGAWVQTGEVRRVYDGMSVVQERNAQNQVLCIYTRGSDMGGGIGGLLAQSTLNGALFYHYDGRGNVTQLTNSQQQVVARYGYDAFGNTSASGTAAGLNRYRFSTKEQIGGLYYYGYRFYSPGLGRWLNRDPIEEDGGLNLYDYVGNSPINEVDPWGLYGGTGIGGPPVPYPSSKPDCFLNCAIDTMGLRPLIGAGMVGIGLPTIPKPFVTPGSSPGTSPASDYLSKKFPRKLPCKVWAPTWKRPLACSNICGRIIVRWIPWVGGGLLAVDAATVAKCTSECLQSNSD